MPQINVFGSGGGGGGPQRPTEKYGPQFDAAKRAAAERDTAWEAAYQQRATQAKRAADRLEREDRARRVREEREGASEVASQNRQREAVIKRNAAESKRLENLKLRVDRANEQAETNRLRQSFRSFNFVQGLRRRVEAAEERERKQDYRDRVAAFRQSARGSVHVSRLRRQEEQREVREQEAARREEVATFRQSARTAAMYARMRARESARQQKEAAFVDPMTYRLSNIRRIGYMGATATDRGEWYQRTLSRMELGRIERRFGSDQRVATAVQAARARMTAADEGINPVRLRYGAAAGFMRNMMSNPFVDTAVAATVGAISAPMITAAAGRKVMQLSAPYTDLQRGAYRLGRAGGFGGQGLVDMLNPGVLAGTPAWMKLYGVGPLDVLNTLNDYGIAPRGPGQAGQIARSILGGAFGMGITGQQAARSGALGSTLGITSGNALDIYFRKLQSVTAFAVSQGLDRSQSIANVEGLLRQGAAAGGGAGLAGGDQMMSLYMKMASSGLAGARTGQLQSSLVGGVANTFGSVGYLGNPLQSTALATVLARKGIPTTAGQLQSLLGNSMSVGDITRTPGGAAMVNNLLSAGRSGNMASAVTWLGQIVSANPQAAMSLMTGSGLFTGMTPDLRDIGMARMLGTSPAAIAAYGAGVGGPVPGMPMAGGYMTPTPAVAAALMGMGKMAPGLSQAQLVAQSIAESGLNPGRVSPKGAYGLMQLMPGTAAEMERNLGFAPGSSYAPAVNAALGAAYMQQLYSALPNGMDPSRRWDVALAEYNWGPSHLKDILAGRMPNETRAYVESAHTNIAEAQRLVGSNYNLPEAYRASVAALGQQETQGARGMFSAVGSHIGAGTGDAVYAFTGALGHASDLVNGLATALDHAVNALNVFSNTVSGSTGRGYRPKQPDLGFSTLPLGSVGP